MAAGGLAGVGNGRRGGNSAGPVPKKSRIRRRNVVKEGETDTLPSPAGAPAMLPDGGRCRAICTKEICTWRTNRK